MKKHPIHTIESEKNPVFIDLRKLLTPRGIKKQKVALVSGEKVVKEALERFPQRCDAWVSGSEEALPPINTPGHVHWYQLSPKLFKILDVFGTGTPLLRIKTPSIQVWSPEDGFPLGLSVMIPFQDPENVGAVIRSAVAFGARMIILLDECAHPYHPKTLRASGGAVLHAPLFQGPSIKDLPEDMPILALSPDGKDISEFSFPKRFAVLPGVEGKGLPNHLRTRTHSIPIRPEVESLNAAAATAIVLFLWDQSKKTLEQSDH